jgi:uncharacterized protein (DUF111 family)
MVRGGNLLVLRPHSGISGDIFVAGLAHMAGVGQDELDAFLGQLGLAGLIGRVKLVKRAVNGITGEGLQVKLEPEGLHRTFSDVRDFLDLSDLTPRAKELALGAFTLLAEAEGKVHGLSAEEVQFHEVGAIDSLLDIGLASLLFDQLDPVQFVCGPLPLCDGTIECAHGLLPSPAPAVSLLLDGVTVCGIASTGETVTPTGLALLKSFGAVFGPWPTLTVEQRALVYGTRVLPNVPNGALFAFGPAVRELGGSMGG